MNKRIITLFMGFVLVAAGTTALWAGGRKEAAYPTRPAEFLIPFGAGGSADVLGRAIASAAKPSFGQSFVPINKPGAGGGIMYQALFNAKPDGYTVGWNSTSILTSTIIGNVPFKYDALTPVCRIGYTSMPIVVKADSRFKTLKDLVDYAKANPGKVKIGNAGTGSATHLTAVAFATAANIDVTHVPLGASRRVPALLGGEVQAVVVPLPGIASYVQSGDARVLAFPTAERQPGYPNVPTLKQDGYDVVIELFRGISVTKGTPEARVKKLEAAFKAGSGSAKFRDIAKKNGFIVSFMDTSQFTTYLARQYRIIYSAMKAGRLIH
jgi:tripartite-type tricarboxylate transporter receptor subunit TctC